MLVSFVLMNVLCGCAFIDREMVVVMPAWVLLNCAAVYFVYLSLPGFQFPVFEIGTLFGAAITLYGVAPLLQHQFKGGIYGTSADLRLWMSQPTAEEVGLAGWTHVVYFLAFAVAYLLVRRNEQFEVLRPDPVGTRQLVFAGIFFAGVIALKTGIEIVFNLSHSTYLEVYTMADQLPPLLRQIYVHLSGAAFTLKLIIFCGIFASAREPLRIIAVWVVLDIATLVFSLGGRTGIVLECLAVILCFHVYVRRVNAAALAGMAGAILVAFLVLGVARNTNFADALTGSAGLEQSNEMEAMFANVLDIMQLKSRNMISLPPEAKYSELTAFIPQQFLPFEKFDYSTWYTSITYEVEGYGSCFGVISQAMAGFGWSELVVRGMLTGLLFAGLHRFFIRRSQSWLHCAAYAWFTLWSYSAFRVTSLHPMIMFYLEALPVFLVMRFISRSASSGEPGGERFQPRKIGYGGISTGGTGRGRG